MPLWRSVLRDAKVGDRIGDLFVAEIQERDCVSDLINYHSTVQYNSRCKTITPVFAPQHPKDPRPPYQVDGPMPLPAIRRMLYARLVGAQLTFSF